MANKQLLSLKILWIVSQMEGGYFIFLNLNKCYCVNRIINSGLVFLLLKDWILTAGL